MATIMTKRGQLDNVVTYEHICDTVADMANINPNYITLGSVCIVIKGENDDLEVYMADSKKEWKTISSSSGESGSISSSGIHICAQDEYDSVTGMPTIEDPLSDTFYLTPGGDETNDLYNEWIWLEDDEEWEKFGSAAAAVSQSDWSQSDSSADDFIKNKPAIRQQANGGGILENEATSASGAYSHAEGGGTRSTGMGSHAEGGGTTASGRYSHAEGGGTNASSEGAHAEGTGTTASALASHSEGSGTTASGQSSHSEGDGTTASRAYSHAEGGGTTASGQGSHAEGGNTVASGYCSHAEGISTIANHMAQHVFGTHNVPDNSIGSSDVKGNYVEIVGNGLDIDHRSNARTLDWNGNQEVAGDVRANACGGANPISLVGIANNMIAVQTTQPTTPETKLWISETAQTPIQVPTVQEMNSAIENAAIDVQVNGVSVVQDMVANVPIATSTVPGVAIFGSQNGIQVSNEQAMIVAATANDIRSGTHSRKPIAPSMQHYSTFYGLAKAAGDTTQSQSNNTVGNYTDEAKAAIKNMLGITQTLTVTVLTQDNVIVTGQTVTVRADDLEGEIYATAAYEGQPVSFSLPTGFQYYVSVSDTLDHHFNPTTAKGIIKDANIAVTLQYSDFSIIRTAPDIKAVLNAGIDLTDLVGEQITCAKGSDTLTWDVVDYDATNKSVKLLLHDCFGTANMVFEPAQALMWCENGLAAGAYTFKNSTTSYYFTLTQAIPAGGQLIASDDGTFKTYESQSTMATLETGTVSTTEITGATDLGTTATGVLNHNSRVRYGSNNYAESALLWWLNTDAPAGTLREPVTKFSRAYSYNVPGFLNNLDANFIACLDDVEWLCSTNNIYECPKALGGYTNGIGQVYTITKKIGLASEMEIFGSYSGTADGSTIFDLYNGATADDRKKYRGTSAQSWWLRSPLWNYADLERLVNSSGNAYNGAAYYACAVVPACQISKDI